MVKETTRNVRVARKPMNRRGPQAVSGQLDPNFEYRFVNDKGSRLQVFQQAGWELACDEDITIGDSRVSDASDLGSGKRVISNDGTTSILMRIKKEWYAEDQKTKAQEINEQEAAMRQTASQGADYGSLKLNRD